MTLSFDHTLFHCINQGLANPVLDILCPILRNKYTWIPVYVGGSAWVIYRYRMRGIWMVLCAGLAILFADQGAVLIKNHFHRLRPCHVEPAVRLMIDQCSDTFSFPSNHASNHFALSVYVALLFRRIRLVTVLMLLWAAAVAFSQVYVGIHYPVDVTAGALLGSAIGAGAFWIYTRITAR